MAGTELTEVSYSQYRLRSSKSMYMIMAMHTRAMLHITGRNAAARISRIRQSIHLTQEA